MASSILTTKTIIPEEEDLDDLDDLLSEFNPPPVISNSNYTSTSSPSLPSLSSASSTSIPTASTEDFPDPDSPTLSATEGNDDDDEELTADMQAGLNELLSGLGGGEGGDELDFKKIMEELMRGDMDFSDMPGGGAGGAGAAEDPAALMAALSGLGGSLAGGKGNKKGKKSVPSSSSSSYPTASTSTSTSTSTLPPASFQETIAQTMNKMKASSETVTSETLAKEASEMDPLASMMAKMAGLDPGVLGGDEEGLQGMLDEMMNQLMGRELLYEPLKELSQKYPAYLAENASTLSEKDLTRYQTQKAIVEEIVQKFEEEGADDSSEVPLSPEAEARKSERGLEIVELVGRMNDQGAPPKEIMGEMPPGMDGSNPLGMPALPECPVS